MNQPVANLPASRKTKPRPGARLGLFILAAYAFLAAIGLILTRSDPPRQVDALILLSGGDRARQEETARLYSQEVSSVVILTRTAGPSRGNHLNTLRDLAKLGVPGSAVLFAPGQSDSTYDEARHTLELMEAKDFGDAIVVTDPYHAFRARMIFRGEFHQSGKSVWVRSAREHWYAPLTWMFSLEGWRTSLKEIAKIGAYLLGVKGS